MLRKRVVRIVTVSILMLITGALLLFSGWPKKFVAFMQGPTKVQLQAFMTYQYNTLNHPTGLAAFESIFESGTRYLFITDTGNHVIRLFKTITYGPPSYSIIAGTGSPGYSDGNLSTAQFNTPTGIAADMFTYWWPDPEPNGRFIEYFKIYVNDTRNNSVRKFCYGNGTPDQPDNSGCSVWTDFTTLYTVAGDPSGGFSDGSSMSARFRFLGGMSDMSGNCYISDAGNHSIRKWDGNNVSTFAGDGNPGFVNGYRTSARFLIPGKTTMDSGGNIYVADIGNNAIREIDTSGNVTTCAGAGPEQLGLVNGQGTSACFYRPTSIAYNPADGMLYVADSHNHCIRRIDNAGNVSTYAGTGTAGLVNGPISQAQFNMPTDIAILSGVMYVSDSNNNSIRVIDMSTGQVGTLLN